MHEPLFLLYTLFEDSDLNAYPLPMRLPLLPALTCLPWTTALAYTFSSIQKIAWTGIVTTDI